MAAPWSRSEAERPASVIPNMEKAHIAGWAGQNHFLLVEIRGEVISITPISFEAMRVRDKNDRPIPMPIEVHLPESAPSNLR